MAEQQEVFADPSMEETVLVYLLTDLNRFQDNRNVLDPGIFESRRFQALWDSAVNYYDRFQGLIDSRGLEVLLNEAQVSAEKKADYILLLNGIRSKSAEKSQYLLAIDQLKILQQKRKLYDLASYVATELKFGRSDVNKLSQDVVNKVLGLETRRGLIFREKSLPDSLDERIVEYEDRVNNPHKYVGLPFGIKKLDELTSGIFPQEFALLFGGPGSGKSRFLASVAYNMYSQGYNVLYVTIEMPLGQVGRLFDARDFMVSSAGLRKGKLSDNERKKYKSKKKKIEHGDFYVVDVPQGCSAMALLPVIRRYKTQKRLDAVVVDYLNLMESSTSGSDRNEALRVGNIGRELKMLARMEEVAVLSAAQSVRDAEDLDDIIEVGSHHVGWSYKLPYQCDMMIYLKKPDPASVLSKKMDCMIVKYRDGSNYKLSLGVDFDKTFVGDMDKLLQLSGAIVSSENKSC